MCRSLTFATSTGIYHTIGAFKECSFLLIDGQFSLSQDVTKFMWRSCENKIREIRFPKPTRVRTSYEVRYLIRSHSKIRTLFYHTNDFICTTRFPLQCRLKLKSFYKRRFFTLHLYHTNSRISRLNRFFSKQLTDSRSN